MTEPTVRIFSNELCLLWKSDPFLREKFLYLKQSGSDSKMFEMVHVKPFSTNFQFLEEL